MTTPTPGAPGRRTVAIVMAAGLGTRMKSTTPKVLHRICGRPLVEWVIEAAVEATGARPVVVYSPATDAIRGAIADTADAALQDVPRGTGDAVRAGLAAIPDDVDEVLVLSFGRMIAEGTPREIQGNAEVVSVYLGADDAEA